MAEQMSVGKLFVELLVNDEKFGPALKGATAELNKLAAEAKRAAEQAAKGVQPLSTAFTAVTEAEKKHIAAIMASTAAEKHRAEALGVTVAQLRQVDAALKAGAASTTTATAATKQHTAATKEVAASTGAAAGAATNLRYQLFDVVQQLSAGQNPLMIANQQGFQIAQAFGQAGAGGAMKAFTAALGPLGGLFTAAVGAAGPLLVVVAALAAGYAVFTNESMRIEEATTGARDAAIDAADKIKGTKADMDAGTAAWGRFRDTAAGIATELAVVRGDIEKGEAQTAKRVEKIREDGNEGIRQTAREWAAVTTKIQALDAVTYDNGFGFDDIKAAVDALPALRREEESLAKTLAEKRAEMDQAIETTLELGVAEKEADEDEGGKKGKADATKEQADATKERADATRDYARAMEDLAKSSAGAADKARLVSFGGMGGGGEAERTFRVAIEKSRQEAEKALDAVDDAFTEALAAASAVGGSAGKAMADAARVAVADARRAITDEFVAAQDDATRKAEKSQQAAAAKRVESDAAAISISVGNEEQFAETMVAIHEATAERIAELQTIGVDYARLTADERLAVEQKVQSEIEGLRERAAEAEIKRAREVAKVNAAVAKDVFAMTKQMVDDVYAFQKDEIASVTEALEADTAVREQIANGEAVSAEERAKMLTSTERAELEERQIAQKEAALASYRAQQALGVVSIAISTATAIVRALADLGPIAGGIAGAVIGGIGAVQAGLVLAQPPPEFHVGGVVAPEDRNRSPGRSTDRAVVTELEVGEGVLVSRAVRALGGAQGLARLNVDPVGAMQRVAASVQPAGGAYRPTPARFDARNVSPSPLPPIGPGGASAAQGGRAERDRPIVVVSKIGERTFDTIMADGLGGRRLPKVRSRLQRMTGVTAGLEG